MRGRTTTTASPSSCPCWASRAPSPARCGSTARSRTTPHSAIPRSCCPRGTRCRRSSRDLGAVVSVPLQRSHTLLPGGETHELCGARCILGDASVLVPPPGPAAADLGRRPRAAPAPLPALRVHAPAGRARRGARRPRAPRRRRRARSPSPRSPCSSPSRSPSRRWSRTPASRRSCAAASASASTCWTAWPARWSRWTCAARCSPSTARPRTCSASARTRCSATPSASWSAWTARPRSTPRSSTATRRSARRSCCARATARPCR